MKITDTMRLDWLQKNKAGVWWCVGCWTVLGGKDEKSGLTLRQAIDAAIKSESKGGKV